MRDETLKPAWFAAEADLGGKPIMIRGRKLPPSLAPDTRYPYLFVMRREYVMADDTGLPTGEQYDEIADLERDVLDRLEKNEVGIVTFIETRAGTISYYCYVRSVDHAETHVHEQTAERVSWNLAADHDPEWAEYFRLMSQVTN